MKIVKPLVEGVFLSRDNRFRASVRVGDRVVAAHVPNSGRLTELFIPGRPVLLAEAGESKRLTKYDLSMVSLPGTLVSIDARLPNCMVEEAVISGRLEGFEGYTKVEREVHYGRSRLDLLLEGEDGRCWVEAKSVTLVREGIGYFPDAVTSRGSRHLEELVELKAGGERAAIVFVVQREDASSLSPYDESDPGFGAALREAVRCGVEAYAYSCCVSREEIVLEQRIPVLL
ncbi:MAG: DNA/RNA nuclease SfsA [Anaerolineae bacterium]